MPATRDCARDRDPDNPIIHWSLGYTYALLGRRDDAQVQAEWMKVRVPAMPYTVQLAALLDALDGRLGDALSGVAAVEAMTFDGHITFHLSESHAMAGNVNTALRLLGQAVDLGFYPRDYIATYCPFLAPLRGTSEFARIAAHAAERVAAFTA